MPNPDRPNEQPMWTRRSFLTATAAGLAGWTTAGCAWFKKPPVACRDISYLSAPIGFSYFVAPQFTQRPPRRVLLLAAECLIQPIKMQRQFTGILADQMRQAQLFEVIEDPGLDGCKCDLNAIVRGRFDERHLLELTDRHRCDGLMLTRVNRINTHWPMQMSATTVLIDRSEAIVLFAADGMWDTNEPELARYYVSYCADQSTGVAPAFANINQQSPKQLQRFVAWQIARVMLT